MHSLKSLPIALLSILSIAAAQQASPSSPSPTPSTTSEIDLTPSATAALEPETVQTQHKKPLYYLRTCTEFDESHNDLWVTACPIGGGKHDVVLSPYKHKAVKGFLEDSHQQFALDWEEEWGMYIKKKWSYKWWPVQINPGRGTRGFWINEEDKLIFGDGKAYSWLVCYWAHEKPQLFYAPDFETTAPLSCTRVALEVDYVDKGGYY
ncbi:hypothetical protein FQN55_000854 [Onygenales sp. PD_40]|nr:hypothetical protein FQN55_000854 [Onygenales sp. PD_40]KAK2796272.1 hypothetical protein FQN51_009483 [Onygenales sp. PD_10]